MSQLPTRRFTRSILECASGAAIEAGSILRRGIHGRIRVAFKGQIDPVTEYDLRSQRSIVRQIRRTFPDHDILAEEGTASHTASPFRWVIDPLDGTVNYAHRFPIYCVSIGIQYEERELVAVVYDPERNELFTAIRGEGARLNGKLTHVSVERNLTRALLATGFSYSVRTDRKNNLGYFARAVKTVQGVRRPGAAAIDLCWLACGRLDGFWELDLHPWDTCAAILIIQEAGGRVSQMDGSPFSIFDRNLLASNGPLHTPLRKLFGTSPDAGKKIKSGSARQ